MLTNGARTQKTFCKTLKKYKHDKRAAREAVLFLLYRSCIKVVSKLQVVGNPDTLCLFIVLRQERNIRRGLLLLLWR